MISTNYSTTPSGHKIATMNFTFLPGFNPDATRVAVGGTVATVNQHVSAGRMTQPTPPLPIYESREDLVVVSSKAP